MTPAELAARLAALEEEEEAAEEAAYLAAVAAGRSQPTAKPRKLSEDEVQQRIAVMKGEVSPRAPVPQVGLRGGSARGAGQQRGGPERGSPSAAKVRPFAATPACRLFAVPQAPAGRCHFLGTSVLPACLPSL